MLKSIKKIGWSLLNRIGVGGIVQLSLQSALKDNGWFKSFERKQSIDAAGNPLPWYTYSFISFLTPRVKPSFEVFEYGCGNSTLWYAQRVKQVVAVENDAYWYEIVQKKMPSNAQVIYKALGEEYIQSSSSTNKLYDIIVVDGRDRVACTLASIHGLKEEGVLILDNAERTIYEEAKVLMAKLGYKRLDFYGMTPIVAIESCTCVFYKTNNCLDI